MPRPRKTATGATPATSKASTATVATSPTHQTHGGFTPIAGPITSVRQLIRTPNVAKGAIGGFPTLQAYSGYLKGLSTVDLHRHAIEEAHIVAIDNRDQLIRRLETEWSGHNLNEANGVVRQVPKREPFTSEQIAAQEALRRKMLGHRA